MTVRADQRKIPDFSKQSAGNASGVRVSREQPVIIQQHCNNPGTVRLVFMRKAPSPCRLFLRPQRQFCHLERVALETSGFTALQNIMREIA